MAGTITYRELVDALEVADNPEARKRIKAAIYALVDPDPLYLLDEHAVDRYAAGCWNAPDLHGEHPTVRTAGSLRARISRWLDRAAVVRRQPRGGPR